MVEKMHFFKTNFDHVRRVLMAEPRGHKDMYGCLLTQPNAKEADYGIIFMDNTGYWNMCGHATIGVSTALVELGMVARQEPFTQIVFESPGGIVAVDVAVNNGRAENVCFRNVPAYAEYLDADLEVPSLERNLKVDVAYGGNYFVFFSAKDVNLEIQPNNIEKIIDTAMQVMKAANQQLSVQHPVLEHNNYIYVATIVGTPENSKAHYQNVHVFSSRQFDHSPGGTGTSARMAVLHAKDQLKLKEEIWAESITGGLFRGRLLEETTVGNKKAVVPEISGRAHITGFHQFVVDENDRLKNGFLIQQELV
jgi:proline racemase/trans-L-3-hydroxyproline dehydratase